MKKVTSQAQEYLYLRVVLNKRQRPDHKDPKYLILNNEKKDAKGYADLVGSIFENKGEKDGQKFSYLSISLDKNKVSLA